MNILASLSSLFFLFTLSAYGAVCSSYSNSTNCNADLACDWVTGGGPPRCENAPNAAPTNITLSASSVAENLVSGSTVGTFTTTDTAGNTHTYSLVTGTGSTDNASFSISGNQLLTNATFNYEIKNSYSIRVRTTDQGGLTFEKIFTITVTNVNEAPTITAPNSGNAYTANVAENTTAIADVDATDVEGNTLTYSLSGTDAAKFTITSSTGVIAFLNPPDYEVPTDNGTNNIYNFTVTVSDGSLTDTQNFTITVTDVIELAGNYQLDQCSWNGTANEVIDNSANGYHGSLKKKTMILDSGKVCRAATQFNDDSYIELPTFPNLTSNMTITAWFKTTDITESGQRIFEDDASNSNGYAVSVGDGGTGRIRFYDRSQSGAGIIDSDALLQNNTWYFVAAVTDITAARRYLYLYDVNGNLINQKSLALTNTSRGFDSGVATIGGEPDGGETANRFKGSIDEVKVFTSPLTQTQIETILGYEKQGLNYDGTSRPCVSCGAPSLNTCWTEDFTNANTANYWTIIKNQNYTPQVVGGKLMLTNATGNVATGMTLSGQLPANDNYIQIEFEQNAYGGSGADGITLALSDASIIPVAGAYGGSLGYAQRTGVNGFAGGWLGFGIDEYGNYSNPTEGRSGGPGLTLDSFAIRGEGSGTTGYAYIAGTSVLSPGIDVTSSATPAPGHNYRLSIDTRNNQTWIKVERNTGSGYTTIINWADATQAAASPQDFRLSLTGSTGGSTNYHSVDNFVLNAINCGTIGLPLPTASTAFDAWDSFRSISDRNISTKIVNKPFTLTIGSFNSAKSALQTFKGTVCAQLINQSGNAISGWNKLYFNDQNSTSTTFTPARAIGGSDSAGVKLVWKKDVNEACPLINETNSTVATDRFAIRPASFAVSAPNAVAGVDFNITFTAPIFGAATASNDYNESVGSSFDVAYAEHNASCLSGAFTPSVISGWSFSNGSKKLTTRYNEVGLIDLNISDATKPCSSKFARVDCDDKDVSSFYNNLTDLPIGTALSQISIRPHHFDLNATLTNANTGAFTYLSSDLSMSAKLDLNVTAKNGEGVTTRNYDKGCYAKSTTLRLPHSSVPDPLTKILYLEHLSTLENNVSKSGDITIGFNSSIFTQGSAPLEIDLNFDRDHSKPLNPFDFTITSATLTDTDGVTGTKVPTGDATFVYGRTRAYDMKTDQPSAPNPIELEVYSTASTGYVSGMPQNVLHWYRNLNHDGAAEGGVLGGGFAAGATNNAEVDASAVPANGLHPITVTSTTDQTVHLDISPWLWYSTNLAKTYNFSADCTQHPCFTYQTFGTGSVTGVQSGTFSGSDFTIDNAQTTIKKGVKVFR